MLGAKLVISNTKPLIPTYKDYFFECEAISNFKKEYISLWPGWLGIENLHKLQSVTETDWSKFNTLITTISDSFQVWIPNHEAESLTQVIDIQTTLSSYEESEKKDSSQFSQYLIYELGCVITESWDYTYILWHQDNHAVETIKPFVVSADLFSFRD